MAALRYIPAVSSAILSQENSAALTIPALRNPSRLSSLPKTKPTTDIISSSDSWIEILRRTSTHLRQ